MSGDGSSASPWQLTTPPGTSAYAAYRDAEANPPALVVQVGKTQLRYHLRCIEDLHGMLVAHGDWIPLGSADEQKPAAADTVEAWGRAASNPVNGWYGLKNGFRGRFGMYVPPVLELLGLAEVEHGARNNRMRAVGAAAKPQIAAPAEPAAAAAATSMTARPAAKPAAAKPAKAAKLTHAAKVTHAAKPAAKKPAAAKPAAKKPAAKKPAAKKPAAKKPAAKKPAAKKPAAKKR